MENNVTEAKRYRFARDYNENVYLIPDGMIQEFHAQLCFPNEQRRRLFDQYAIADDAFTDFTFLDPQEER